MKNVSVTVLNDTTKEFLFIPKLNCDWNTGHSDYKQRSLEDVRDCNIYITSVIPLQLHSTKTSGVKRNEDLEYLTKFVRQKFRSWTKANVFNLLLVSSNPLTTNFRKLPKKATQTYLPEAPELLAAPKEPEDWFVLTLTKHRRWLWQHQRRNFLLIPPTVFFLSLCHFHEYSLKTNKKYTYFQQQSRTLTSFTTIQSTMRGYLLISQSITLSR